MNFYEDSPSDDEIFEVNELKYDDKDETKKISIIYKLIDEDVIKKELQEISKKAEIQIYGL